MRLDRNRNLITAEEQDRLGRLRIGIVGLSVGHAIAHILAQQGLCGQLRLADFDELELSNLNRVPATVFDLGAEQGELAARRIAETRPVSAGRGLRPRASRRNPSTRFLDGVDILVEECDSLDTKVARPRRPRGRVASPS